MDRTDNCVRPIMPVASPTVEEADVKKIRKKVGSSTLMIIKSGKRTPRKSRNRPMVMRKRGFFIMIYITNKQQNERVPVRNRVVLPHYTSQPSPLSNAGGIDIPLAGL